MSNSSLSSEDTLFDFTHSGRVSHVRMSQEEVAQLLGVSRQAVHKMERRIVWKLRLALLEILAEENPKLCLKIIAKWRRLNEK